MSFLDLLVRPGEFFENHPWSGSFGAAFVVVLVLALVSAAGFMAMGWVLADEVEGTTTVDNPQYTPEWVCEQHEDDSAFGSGCDEPKTIEVENSELLWEEWTESGYVGLVLIAIFVGWLLTAVALHVVSAVADGEGSFTGTMTVAGLGMAPAVFERILSIALWWYQVRTTELSSDPEALMGQIEGVEPMVGGAVLTIVFGLWQAYIWYHGLRHARDLDADGALVTVAVVTAIYLLFGLL